MPLLSDIDLLGEISIVMKYIVRISEGGLLSTLDGGVATINTIPCPGSKALHSVLLPWNPTFYAFSESLLADINVCEKLSFILLFFFIGIIFQKTLRSVEYKWYLKRWPGSEKRGRL